MTWQDHAACRGMNPDLFFPEAGGSTNGAHAKRVCLTCPVRDHCLEYALAGGERFGIWGGMGEPERKRARRLRNTDAVIAANELREASLTKRASRRQTSVAKCGTYAGYKRHQRAGEEPCDECRQANAHANRMWARNRQATA